MRPNRWVIFLSASAASSPAACWGLIRPSVLPVRRSPPLGHGAPLSATQSPFSGPGWSSASVDGLIGKVESANDAATTSLDASSSPLAFLTPTIESVRSALGTVHPSIGGYIDAADTILALERAAPFLIAAGIIAALYDLSHPSDDFRSGSEPYRRGRFDPIAARAYYRRRPFLVMRRLLQLLLISNRFLFHILVDKYITKDEEGKLSERAGELLELVQRAGPTAIKVGQALSVRPDLIPYEYAEALATLQDRVPAFDGDRARKILEDELGPAKLRSLKSLELGKGPVASASIGQVYKASAKLDDGTVREVAVKVQRPDVLAEIALDLYLVREIIAPVYKRFARSATDLQGLASEWGRGFIAELDYHTEAANTKSFNVEIQRRGLTAVSAPVVVDEFSAERVLTTEWVNGLRLDESAAEDVPRLCSVALNAYLVMLLETGTLHCDPHPGNLLRTEDGRLCILDWGMTVETDVSLQYSLLEFVAHLTSESYREVPDDLVKLGFLRADRVDTVRASGFLEPLTYMLSQAREGGGGKKVRERIFAEYREKYPGLSDDDLRIEMRAEMQERIEESRKTESAVTGITMEVEELQRRNRDAFTIPEWFLYTSRAFLTLEGISLQADEDYSIVQSCFPYVARRLLGDDSPRAQEALRDLIYGTSGNMSIDPERLTDLADGFSTYTTTTKSTSQENAPVHGELSAGDGELTVGGSDSSAAKKKSPQLSLAQTEATLTLAKDGAEILLNPEGNLIQNILVDEGALAASAGVKDALRDLTVDGPRRFRDALPLGLGSVLPESPLGRSVEPFLRKTDKEERAQALAEKLAAMAPRPPSPPSLSDLTGRLSDNAANWAADKDTTSASALTSVETTTDALRDVDPEEVALVARELRLNLPRYAPLVGQLGGKFASTLLERASSNIEGTLTEIEGEKASSESDAGDNLVKTAARGLSRAASQGADAIRQRQSTA